MELVVVESPFSGDVEGNIDYARRCCRDAIERGEAPYASHLFYTQQHMLDDTVPVERELGICMGFLWGATAGLTAVYVDYGISRGMVAGILRALNDERPIDIRSLRGPALLHAATPTLFEMCPQLLEGCWTMSWRSSLAA